MAEEMKSISLRDLARGKPCYLRILGCAPGPENENVVLCHVRRGGIAGTGQKPCDLAALPMCDHCHGIYDARVKSSHSRAELDADALRGLCQWLSYLMANGYIHIGAPK